MNLPAKPPLSRAPRRPRRSGRRRSWIPLLAALSLAIAAAENPPWLMRSVEIPEVGRATNCLWGLGTNRLSFVAPRGWEVAPPTAEQSVSLQSTGRNARIQLQWLPTPPGRTNAWTPAELRQKAQEKFPGVKVGRDYPCYAGFGAGVGFECEAPATNAPAGPARVALLPVQQDLLLLSLQAPTSQLASARFALANLLNSCLLETNGTKR